MADGSDWRSTPRQASNAGYCLLSTSPCRYEMYNARQGSRDVSLGAKGYNSKDSHLHTYVEHSQSLQRMKRTLLALSNEKPRTRPPACTYALVLRALRAWQRDITTGPELLGHTRPSTSQFRNCDRVETCTESRPSFGLKKGRSRPMIDRRRFSSRL